MAAKSKTAGSAKNPDTEAGPRAFLVTENAGPKVAGRRVKAGDVISLEEAEAAHEWRTGAIVPAPATETPDKD